MNRRILLLIFCMITGMSMAQVQFRSEASKTELGINERLRIDFTMNRDGDNFKPPSFSDFKVIAGPNQAVSNSWINGKRSYSKTYSYYLAPTKRGTFTIGQAEITIDGEVYKTSPVKITVTAAVDVPKDGNNAEYVASENLHLVAEISNTNPYLNEAISIVYKLYVSPRINVRDWREIDRPNYREFWSQEIRIPELKVETGEYKGKPYRYVVLKKTVLYPQKTGKLKIEPLSLSVLVQVPSEKRDIYGNIYYESVDKTVAAGNRIIQVKPLPEEGKPENFTGAVASDLDFKVSVNKEHLNATESLQAKVEVTGGGNLKLFDLPVLTTPAALEKYEPEYSENIRTTLRGMKGSLSNTYTLIPQRKGKYPIPPVSFTYFDLDSETYKTLVSDEIIIEVGAAPGGLAANSSAARVPAAGTRSLPESNFRFIKLETDLLPLGQKPFLGSFLFWGLFSLPLLFIPLAVYFRKRRQVLQGDTRVKRGKKADRLARKYLSESKKNLGDQEKFYESLERALHNYLKAKLHIQTSEMHKEHIKDLLGERGVAKSSGDEFNKVLESCEFARYTPASNLTMEKDYRAAKQVISDIDRQL